MELKKKKTEEVVDKFYTKKWEKLHDEIQLNVQMLSERPSFLKATPKNWKTLVKSHSRQMEKEDLIDL